jgi:hypothetical protein
MSVRDLLATHEAVLETLRSRGVVRTSDEPAVQYAKWLAHQAFGGTIEADTTKAHDLVTAEGRRMRVAGLVIRSTDAGERQLPQFRGADFDEVLVALFDPSYDLLRASVLTTEQVMRLARWQPHINGRVLIARDAVLDLGTDVKRKLRNARQPVAQLTRAART